MRAEPRSGGWAGTVAKQRVDDFGWQDGDGAFTVRESVLPDLRPSLGRHAEHPRRVSFQPSKEPGRTAGRPNVHLQGSRSNTSSSQWMTSISPARLIRVFHRVRDSAGGLLLPAAGELPRPVGVLRRTLTCGSRPRCGADRGGCECGRHPKVPLRKRPRRQCLPALYARVRSSLYLRKRRGLRETTAQIKTQWVFLPN